MTHSLKPENKEKQAAPTLGVSFVTVTPFQQNCSLVWCTKTRKAALVDPGGEMDRIKAMVDAQDVQVETILLTHGHIDHAGAAHEASEFYKAPLIGPHKDDIPLLKALPDQARMFGVEDIPIPEPDQWLEDGDTIAVGELQFDVLHCPGHAPGHVVFFNRDNRFAIMGDVLFQGSIGRTDLPGGDYPTLMRSIFQKILPLGDDIVFLCGHGPGSTIGQERMTNPFLRQR
jgi:glyoxylase-like metal-dependent hydrolase (beta-lactamase superfamily II)